MSNKRCFIISPIGAKSSDTREHADAVLQYIIRPALIQIENDGGPTIEAVRSDELGTPGRIEEQMVAAILGYDLCIAILSGANANVYYELAIAQSAGRPVVLMCLADEPLPFDVKDYRTIYYDLKPKNLMEKTWVPQVAAHVKKVIERGYEPPSILKSYTRTDNGTKSYLLNAQSKEFGDAPQFNQTVSETKDKCDLMGIALSSWAVRKASTAVLADLGNRRVRTRILTMHPENPALGYLVNEHLINESLDGSRKKVEKMAEFFRDIQARYPTIEFRQLKQGLPHNQIIVTDQTALVLQYLFSRGTDESPLLQCPAKTELYDVFAEEFETLWALNSPGSGAKSR